jgi:hypothetical protein
MKILGDRNYALIEIGAKTTGDYEETYHYIYESLYVDEADEIREFLMWCKRTGRAFGHGNYESVFADFKGATA